MRCLWLHQWREVSREAYLDTSYGWNIPRTEFLSLCERCGKRKSEHVDGNWVKAEGNR